MLGSRREIPAPGTIKFGELDVRLRVDQLCRTRLALIRSSLLWLMRSSLLWLMRSGLLKERRVQCPPSIHCTCKGKLIVDGFSDRNRPRPFGRASRQSLMFCESQPFPITTPESPVINVAVLKKCCRPQMPPPSILPQNLRRPASGIVQLEMC
jgi:hypothetical protein